MPLTEVRRDSIMLDVVFDFKYRSVAQAVHGLCYHLIGALENGFPAEQAKAWIEHAIEGMNEDWKAMVSRHA